MSDVSDKPLGTPSPFADRRGGPGTHTGIYFQDDVTLYQALRLIALARYDPSTTATLQAEVRIVVPADIAAEITGDPAAGIGQYGFDLGWEDCPDEIDVLAEVKYKPTQGDIRELVARLPHMAALGRRARSIWMIAGAETAPYKALARLCFHAGEAKDNDALRQLVDDAQDAAEIALLPYAGDDPITALALARPESMPTLVVEDLVVRWAHELAAPGRWEDLVRRITGVVVEAAKKRQAVALGPLIEALTVEGILSTPPRADTSHLSPELVVGLNVLSVCPLPVPVSVLAHAAGTSEGAIVEALAAHVRLDQVVEIEDGFYASSILHTTLPTPAGHESWASRALEGLFEHRRATSGARPEQSANALALAREALASAPQVVAETFIEFDKASKAYGDLAVIDQLARLSNQAAVKMAGVDPAHANHWAIVRARNDICGVGWVLQRVGELDAAGAVMAEAEGLSAGAGDPENMAFSAKCAGRLLRMRAEIEPDPAKAEEFYAESAAKLREAFDLFEGVLRGKTGFEEDYGECKSLLARTLANQSLLDEARIEAEEAHRHLNGLPSSKAYADLLILEAEIALRDHEHNPDDPTLMEALRHQQTVLGGLEETHPVVGDPARRRGPSEVAARLLLIRGQVAVALGDIDAGAELMRQAAAVYTALDYTAAAEQAAWDAFALHPESAPQGLLDALDDLDAAPGARLFAVEKQQNSGTLASVGMTDDTHPRWEGMAREAVEVHRARTTHWSGERSTA